MRLANIEEQALAEIREEERAALVSAAKDRIRADRGRPWYVRMFPYRIRVEKL